MHFKPTQTLNKVSVATFASAVVGVAVWILQEYVRVTLPLEIVGALNVIAVFAAGYLTPIAPGELESVPHTAPARQQPAAMVDQPRISTGDRVALRREMRDLLAELLDEQQRHSSYAGMARDPDSPADRTLLDRIPDHMASPRPDRDRSMQA